MYAYKFALLVLNTFVTILDNMAIGYEALSLTWGFRAKSVYFSSI